MANKPLLPSKTTPSVARLTAYSSSLAVEILSGSSVESDDGVLRFLICSNSESFEGSDYTLYIF
jgi:hypothetical protein